MLVGTFGYSLTAIVSGAALLLALRTKVLAAGPLLHIGKVSYGMYLYHPIVFMIVSSLLALAGLDVETAHGMLLRLLVLTAATVAVATASYWLVESRILAFKGRFEALAATPKRYPAS
jgi:peptidoglycan/LPS O-acetylase OafA/YrhL